MLGWEYMGFWVEMLKTSVSLSLCIKLYENYITELFVELLLTYRRSWSHS